MLAHLEELQIEKRLSCHPERQKEQWLLSPETRKCRELARRFPEKYVWMCNLDENCEETIEERLREYQRQGAVGIGEFMICRKITILCSGCISGGGKTGNANPVSYESAGGI